MIAPINKNTVANAMRMNEIPNTQKPVFSFLYSRVFKSMIALREFII